MVTEVQLERVTKVKDFLRRTPNVPHDSESISSATGVPKSRIDYGLSLSSDPAIRRETLLDPHTGAEHVYWTYIAKGNSANALVEPDELSFLPWRSWTDRRELNFAANDLHAGLYLLSRFEKPPVRGVAPSAKDLPAEVFYIGMSKDLNNRPLKDHVSGRQRYRDIHKKDALLEKLYVSICPIFAKGCQDHALQYARLQYLEMKLAWHYTSTYKKALHYKKRRGR